MPLLTNDVLTSVKRGVVTKLSADAALDWAHGRTVHVVTDFGVPARRYNTSAQMILSAEPSGQDGGMMIFEITLEIAAVIRYSIDAQGKLDYLMERAWDGLAKIQQSLEGQHLAGYLTIPLYTDLGPTRPELWETEPPFGMTYLSMSAKYFSVVAEAMDKATFAAWDQGLT